MSREIGLHFLNAHLHEHAIYVYKYQLQGTIHADIALKGQTGYVR